VTLSLLFWLLMVLWLVFGLGWGWPRDAAARYVFGSWLLVWVIIALLGWRVFGFVVQG
jgi:hypothetical protein